MTDASELAELYMETTCHTAFPNPRRRVWLMGEPEVIKKPRPAWHENVEAYARYRLANMLPDTRIVIKGVSVQRYTHAAGVSLRYDVEGYKCTAIEDAVCKIIEIINQRKDTP